ncbi:hypothetical protein KM043_005140 [Ampulex compressa]|nr:hypothetical protein KM043_005140 [Ampulex compressa]
MHDEGPSEKRHGSTVRDYDSANPSQHLNKVDQSYDGLRSANLRYGPRKGRRCFGKTRGASLDGWKGRDARNEGLRMKGGERGEEQKGSKGRTVLLRIYIREREPLTPLFPELRRLRSPSNANYSHREIER